MPTDWGPIVQTGIGAVAAIGGGCVGAWVQGRYQQRTERDRRRERAAEILAEVRALLTDANPDPLGTIVTEEWLQETFPTIRDRWLQARIPLLTIAVARPSKQVSDLARRLEEATSGTLARVGLFLFRIVRSQEFESVRLEANQMRAEAIDLLNQLEEAIQRG